MQEKHTEISRQLWTISKSNISEERRPVSRSTWEGLFSHERFSILHFTPNPGVRPEKRHASGAACNFAKQQNCTVRILRALILTPSSASGDHPRTPASIFAPAKKSSVSWWLSHHPRALFSTANPIPRASSFRGNPSHPFTNVHHQSSPSPFREPIRE